MGQSNFECDRPAKNDFTASTVQYLERTGHRAPVSFYEENTYGTLVPFGSPDASPYAHIDVYMQYGNAWYAIELKERTGYNSNSPYIISSGTYYNYEKDEALKESMKKGYIPLFADLYSDGVIRVWNVSNVNVEELPVAHRKIKRYSCIASSPKEEQDRPCLAVVSAVTTYKRIKSMEL